MVVQIQKSGQTYQRKYGKTTHIKGYQRLNESMDIWTCHEESMIYFTYSSILFLIIESNFLYYSFHLSDLYDLIAQLCVLSSI